MVDEKLLRVEPGEVFWAASDVGWVVGHSYIVYAPLFHGCTTILYEGKPVGTPDAGAFWRVISEHNCAAMFTAPTAFRAIKKEDPQGKLNAQYDLSCFRALFLAGERADPDTVIWAEPGDRSLVADRDRLGDRRQSVRPRAPASQARLTDRTDVRVVDENCNEVAPNTMGSIVIKLPLPPSCLPTLWVQTSASGRATSPSSPATTKLPTPVSRTGTATST
jgi:propionyl-CoA synthetase